MVWSYVQVVSVCPSVRFVQCVRLSSLSVSPVCPSVQYVSVCPKFVHLSDLSVCPVFDHLSICTVCSYVRFVHLSGHPSVQFAHLSVDKHDWTRKCRTKFTDQKATISSKWIFFIATGKWRGFFRCFFERC